MKYEIEHTYENKCKRKMGNRKLTIGNQFETDIKMKLTIKNATIKIDLNQLWSCYTKYFSKFYRNFLKNNWIRQGIKQAYKVALKPANFKSRPKINYRN